MRIHSLMTKPPADRLLQVRGFLAIVLGLTLLGWTGCRPRNATESAGIRATAVFTPNPPIVGASGVTVTLLDPAGEPVRADFVDVEANMNHAGMRPVFSRLQETEPGRFTGTVEFTMGGDWFLLVTGQGADGFRIDQSIQVPGVRAK